MGSLTSRSAPNNADASGAHGLSSPIAEQRFREIVPPLLDDAYSLAKWLSQSPTDAEDIVQNAALRALKALSTVSVDRPKPWFLAIVRNAADDLHGSQSPQDRGLCRRQRRPGWARFAPK